MTSREPEHWTRGIGYVYCIPPVRVRPSKEVLHEGREAGLSEDELRRKLH